MGSAGNRQFLTPPGGEKYGTHCFAHLVRVEGFGYRLRRDHRTDHPARAQNVEIVDEAGTASVKPDTTLVVTGSFIRSSRTDGAMPVDVFTAEDLSKQGISSPLEFIK